VVPSTFGLEGVAHRRPQSGGDGKPVGGTVGGGSEPAGLAAAIHVWTLWRETQALGDVDDPTPDAY